VRRWHFLVLAAVVIAAAALVRAQATPQEQPRSLTDIVVDGVQRYAPADVARLSGLDRGSTVTTPLVQQAAVQLAHTGLFESVRYRFETADGTAKVTFTVEEAPVTIPVVFDNFLAVPDGELRSLVQRDVPGFDGLAPDTAAFPDYLRGVLQRILEARHLGGHVDYKRQLTLRTRTPVDLFAIRDSNTDLRVCRVEFPGAEAVRPADILASSDPVVGVAYSRFFTTSLVQGNWLQLYHDRGYWKATLGDPVARLSSGLECGVVVTVAVHEGPSYRWDHAVWSGAAFLSPDALDKLLDMKTGAVAVASKLARGVDRIRHEYATHGYPFARLSLAPALDDATQRMTLNVTISEGAQYRMGTLTITGIADAVAAELRNKWKLKPGAIYDATYLSRFMGDEVEHRRGLGIVPQSFGPHLAPDEATHVINVTFSPD
jgi:outer membrane protein assembly factor BamA